MATFALSPVGASVNGIELYSLELNVTRDVESFNGDVPDPTWTFTDADGHFFAWDADGKLHNLNKRNIVMPCDDICGGTCEGDGYVKVVRECTLCGAPVEPGMRPGTQVVAGNTLYVARVTGPVRARGSRRRDGQFRLRGGFRLRPAGRARGGLLQRHRLGLCRDHHRHPAPPVRHAGAAA